MSQVIDKKLHAAIDKLTDTQKKEVLLFVGNLEHRGREYDKWEDESFVSEMESRYNYYKNGGKMVTAEESEKRINALLEKSKQWVIAMYLSLVHN